MNISCGIVGLPNVGKSTLFNALLKRQQAYVANYPFATIDPNVGLVPVLDPRLEKLADIVERDSSTASVSRRTSLGMTKRRPPIVPATVKFVDIAGLMKGAAEGAGLGNKFLAHIREVGVIAHVIRAFEDESIVREGSVDVKADYETINTELVLADLSSISNIIPIKSGQKSTLRLRSGQKEVVGKLFDALNKGIPAREVLLTDEEKEAVKDLFLLTSKPEIVVLNVSEQDYTRSGIQKIIEQYKAILSSVIAIRQLAEKQSQGLEGIASSQASPDPRNDNYVIISAKIEAEMAELSEEDQKQYLKNIGLEQSGLERLIKKAYQTLGLISFLTAGEKEVRAWTIKRGSKALDAAGEIHTDFINKFIKAEIVSFDDFVKYGGWKGSREKGKTRFEGRDYIVGNGDVIEFKVGS